MVRVALSLTIVTSILGAANNSDANVFLVVAALFGITYGLCIALLPSVIVDSFGSREISGIIGAIYTSYALAALVGPTLAGLLRDCYGNYDAASALCAVLSFATVAASAGVRSRY